MERKRLQHHRMKQQQQAFSLSQQDLTDAIARMKPINAHRLNDKRTCVSATSSIEQLSNPVVSELIKEFEARSSVMHYSSAQDLLSITKNFISVNENQHMLKRCVTIDNTNKGNELVDKRVCSSGNDKSTIIVDRSQQTLVVDENKRMAHVHDKHRRQDNDDCQCTLLLPSTFVYDLVKPIDTFVPSMAIQHANIDTDMLPIEQRTIVNDNPLHNNEEQLNMALADLISLSADTHRSLSWNSSTILPYEHEHRRVSTPKMNHTSKTSLSASIDLLNDLLETFELDTNKSDASTRMISNDQPTNKTNEFLR
jgi:DNA-binding MarR family transcriptional regulator